MPSLYAAIMTGFPNITAITSPLWLTDIVCQFSYPLNSANASPPGTLSANLSWAAETAHALATTTAIAAIPIILLLDLIAKTPCVSRLQEQIPSEPPAGLLDDGR